LPCIADEKRIGWRTPDTDKTVFWLLGANVASAAPASRSAQSWPAMMQTKGESMRKSLIGLSFALGAGFYSWSITAAFAADFYILNIADDNNVALLDPTTIVPAQAGHKVFHFAEIGEFDLWIDNNVEMDCPGKRSRKLSAVSHLGGGSTVQGLASPGPWVNLGSGTVGLKIHDVVCQWPDSKPTGNSVYVATDLKSAVSRISGKVYEWNHEKKK
jgi:hypothetical protein